METTTINWTLVAFTVLNLLLGVALIFAIIKIYKWIKMRSRS